jgi:hypothetical protein
MAYAIAVKNPCFTYEPVTPSGTSTSADVNMAANALAAYTLPRAGPCMVFSLLRFKAVGTALNFDARSATNSALSSNVRKSLAVVDASSNYIAATTTMTLQVWHDDYTNLAAYTGIFGLAAPTGTYTFDVRYEWYPIN